MNAQTRKLGNSNLQVSPLAFGGNIFGWTVDESTSFQLLDAYVGAGLNYTIFYNEKSGDVSSISYDNGFGYALQAGVDYAISGPWSLNIDV